MTWAPFLLAFVAGMIVGGLIVVVLYERPVPVELPPPTGDGPAPDSPFPP